MDVTAVAIIFCGFLIFLSTCAMAMSDQEPVLPTVVYTDFQYSSSDEEEEVFSR